MESHFSGLSLNEDEDDELVLVPGSEVVDPETFELCLVGRFLTDRPLNFNAMKHRMASLWRPGRSMCIRAINTHLFLFQFFHKVDLKRVLEGGPWTFDRHLLILHQVKRGEVPSAIPLFHVSFWVQVHELPVGYMSESVGKQLGNFIGEFIEYDSANNVGVWRNFMRIKVAIDVRQPLKRWKKIKKMQGDWCIVSFKYEKLSPFCFLCGILGHSEKFCEKLFTVGEGEVQRAWGPWLRVPIRRSVEQGGERWLNDSGEILGEIGGQVNGESAEDIELNGHNQGEQLADGRESRLTEKNSKNEGSKSMQNYVFNKNLGSRFGERAGPTIGPSKATDFEVGLEEFGLHLVDDRKRRRAAVNGNPSCVQNFNELTSMHNQGEMQDADSISALILGGKVLNPLYDFSPIIDKEKSLNCKSAGPGVQACREP